MFVLLCCHCLGISTFVDFISQLFVLLYFTLPVVASGNPFPASSNYPPTWFVTGFLRAGCYWTGSLFHSTKH